jgi:hypothetical protein
MIKEFIGKLVNIFGTIEWEYYKKTGVPLIVCLILMSIWEGYWDGPQNFWVIIAGLWIAATSMTFYAKIRRREGINGAVKEYKQVLSVLVLGMLFVLVTPTVIYFSPEVYVSFARAIRPINVTSFAMELTSKGKSDAEKANLIVRWQKSNVPMSYGVDKEWGHPKVKVNDTFYLCALPIVSSFKDPLWGLYSRCGPCGVQSMLFRTLADDVGIPVRSIHAMGEDHSWDEVYVNDEWRVVDYGNTVGQLDKGFYERVGGNGSDGWGKQFSYVFAEYPNGTRMDVTPMYTETSNLTVVARYNGISLKDIQIMVLSNNNQSVVWMNVSEEANERCELKVYNTLKLQWCPSIKMDSYLRCTTNEEGKCYLIVGDGNYTLDAFSVGESKPIFGEENVAVQQGINSTVIIDLKEELVLQRIFRDFIRSIKDS